MEKEEEKAENIKRKRRRRKSPSSSKSSSSFPLDLTSEIFLRLPLNSVVRFGYVSKLWSSITTDPYFINSFEARSPKKIPRILICYKEGDKVFVFSFPQHHHHTSSQPIDHYYHTKFPESGYFFNTQSVHGLICFRQAANTIIWNPTVRKFFPLTKPEKSWKSITFFLGYDPIEGKHKVVCMPRDNFCDECQVLTLGSAQDSWRTVKTNRKHHPFTCNRNGVYGRCINGVIYYIADLDDSDRVIMSFDVRSESFNVITYPWGKFWHMDMTMIPYEGKLAFVNSTRDSVWMWVLEDAEKHKWSDQIFSPIPHYGHDFRNLFKLVGITDDGELIYAPDTFLESLDIIFIDPKRMTFRKVNRGIADDDFRQRNGFGDRLLRGLRFFPNHIETLLSL